MNPIDEDVKHQSYHNLYLIYGNENYLKLQYRDKLVRALVNPGDTMNFTKFEGDKTDPKELMALSDTLPFFAEKRVILGEKTGLFKRTEEEFTDYLSAIPESTVFIFVEDETEGRARSFKAASKIGVVCEMTLPTENTLMAWISRRLEKCGKKMTRDAWNEFLVRTRPEEKKSRSKKDNTGDTMMRMDREIEKLIAYCWDREVVTKEDVEEICTGQVEAKIFEMLDAMAGKNPKKMMTLYRDLLLSKTPSRQILALVVRQFRQMLSVKEMYQNHVDAREIARKAGIPDYLLSKNLSRAQRFTTEMLREFLRDAEEIETSINTGLLDDQLSVEILMTKYASEDHGRNK